MSNFQSQRLDLQKTEIKIMQDSQDHHKKRMKAQDGYAAANSMLEKHGSRMNESQCAYWFQVANKWAMEMSTFEEEDTQPDYDTPVVISKPKHTVHQDEDTTTAFRLDEESVAPNSSLQKKKSKTVKDSTDRNYSLISNSHPVGQVHPPLQPPSTVVTSVIIERSLQHENSILRSDSTHMAAETLEFILGSNGEPIPEPVYQSSIPMYQATIVPSASSHLFSKEPSVPVGLKSSAPSEVRKVKQKIAAEAPVNTLADTINTNSGSSSRLTIGSSVSKRDSNPEKSSSSSSSSSSNKEGKRTVKKRTIDSV